MKLRSIALASRSIRGVCAAGFLAAGLMLAPATLIPTASASCSDVEVVFARGRQESPGAGVIGNAFVSALRSRVNKNVDLGVGGVAHRVEPDIFVDPGPHRTDEGVADDAGAGRFLSSPGEHHLD